MVQVKFKRGAKLYLSSVLVYGVGILILRYFSYYQNTLSYATQKTLFYLFLGFLIVGPLFYLIFPPVEPNKPYLFLKGINRILNEFKIKEEEKVAVLFMLVKLFFLPVMVNFFFNNFKDLLLIDRNFYWYSFVFTLMFTLDTLIFSLGYAFESRKLKNVVKSVEPTLFGWVVAVICYPPFAGWVGNYIPWGANDFVEFWNPTATLILRGVIVLLLVIYVWATVALGPKASNLTNRGIVGKFPYSMVRHPAYISKVSLWWLTLLPVLNWKFALGMGVWTVIYYYRSITEERHLGQDPDYAAYCRKVKWKFIPKVY